MAEDISSGSLKVTGSDGNSLAAQRKEFLDRYPFTKKDITGSVYVPFYGLILTLDILVKEKNAST